MNPEHIEQIIKMIEHNEEVFNVLREAKIGEFLILWVYYPNCPNGNKIMVFTGYYPDTSKKILPHFGREDSPVARFEPTERGWQFALDFAYSQNKLLQQLHHQAMMRS
jgi:hypothetical protein